jgi:ATP-dependent DNA helicase RecQ
MTEIDPQALESQLIEWQDGGLLEYSAFGRTMFISMLKAAPGVKSDMEAMLSRHNDEAQRRLSILADYAKTDRCRHDYISRYFGERSVAECASCDNCVTHAVPSMLKETHRTVLEGMMTIPIRVGKKGLIKAFTGSMSSPIQKHDWKMLGALSHCSSDDLDVYIEDLIAWGYLQNGGNALRPLVEITPAGRKLVTNN